MKMKYAVLAFLFMGMTTTVLAQDSAKFKTGNNTNIQPKDGYKPFCNVNTMD